MKMAQKKNFLLLAIGVGVAGVIIGGITMYNTLNEILQP